MEKKELTNRQAVGIGTQVAIVFMLLIAVFIYFVFFSLEGAIGFSIVSGLPVMLFGIIGAMIGKQWGGTKLTTRIGAIIGDILGVLGLFWFLGSKGFGQ